MQRLFTASVLGLVFAVLAAPASAQLQVYFTDGFEEADGHIAGNDALGTNGHERQRQRVVAAKDGEPLAKRGAKLAYAVGVATSLLDADDILARLGQAQDGRHLNGDVAAAGDAVKDDRQLGRSCDFSEMLE